MILAILLFLGQNNFAAVLHRTNQPADRCIIISLVQQTPLLMWTVLKLPPIYPLSLPLTERKLNFRSMMFINNNFHLFHPPLYTLSFQVYFEYV